MCSHEDGSDEVTDLDMLSTRVREFVR
jgi:hypothetical protein